MSTVIPSTCVCPNACGINLHLEDGEIVKVSGIKEHPVNKGRLCPKGAASLDFYYRNPDRIKHPMKKVNGVFEQITWDEAMDIMSTRLLELREKYGPESMAVMRGMAAGSNEHVGTLLVKRFQDAYGSPNHFTVDNQCNYPSMMGYLLTGGINYRPDGDLNKVHLRVLWGHNIDDCNPMDAVATRQAQKNGLKLIVVDPRRIPLANEADLFIQLRPGSDSALVLGLLNIIITRELYDKEFVANYINGFDKLVEHVKAYPPEVVEKITWVPAEKIVEFAELFASVKPANIIHSYNVLDQQAGGFHAARAIVILHAITGNIDVPGGLVCAPSLYRNGRDIRLRHMVDEDKLLGLEEFPLMTRVNGRHIGDSQGNILPETILTGSPYPIKSLLVLGTNPLLAWGETPKWREALTKLDFLVVMSLLPTEATEIADLVLPASGPFEIDDLCLYNILNAHNYLMPRRKAVQFGEAHSQAELCLDLGKRMGYGEYFPWNDTIEFLNWWLEPADFSYDWLINEKPNGFWWRSMTYGRYKKSGFPTSSGKIEIYAEEMAKYGYDPVPVHIEPSESPYSTPDLAKEYPLILSTGKRIKESLQSFMQTAPKLQKRATEKYNAEIHPDTAKIYNITQGEMINVETPRGSVQIRAEVTEDILPGVVMVPRGRPGTPINTLTKFRGTGNTITGVPEFKALLCRVSKVNA